MDTLLTADMVLLTLGLLVSGYVSGIIAGLLGVGGGIILVPVLFQTFVWFDFPAHLHIHMAVGTSLAIICFTGGQSARSHLKRGAVDIEILKSWGIHRAGRFIGGTLGTPDCSRRVEVDFRHACAGSGRAHVARGKTTGRHRSDTFIARAKTAGRHHRFSVGAHGYWWWHIIRAALGCRRARHAPRRGNLGLSRASSSPYPPRSAL